MVEGICGKILAYSYSGIRSINRILARWLWFQRCQSPNCIRQHLHSAAKVAHKKSINISCKKIDHLGFHQWREIQVLHAQYSRTLALWVSCKNLLEFGKTQFGSNLFYPTDWFLILDSLRTNWLWNQEGTLDQSFDLQKITQTEDNLTNAVGLLLSNFFLWSL